MGHGRFEFEIDFSPQNARASGEVMASQRTEREEAAYHEGFEDGQVQRSADDKASAINLLTAIQADLLDRKKWQSQYHDNVMALIIPTFDRLLGHIAKHIKIDAIIETNQFGMKDLLDRLTADEDPKIYVSEEVYQTLNTTLPDEASNQQLVFAQDDNISGHDFEIRWRNGGVMYSSEVLIDRYRSILAQYQPR